MSATGKAKDESSCTCGQCLDGWLSLRMKERLEAEAEFLHFSAGEIATQLDIENDILDDGSLTDTFIERDTSLHYIPMDLHPKMTPAFHHGYILVLEAIYHIILRDPSSPKPNNDADNSNNSHATVIPTISAISHRLKETQDLATNPPPSIDPSTKTHTIIESECIQTYLSSGGEISYALDALTDSAFEKSPLGSLYHQEPELQVEDAEFEKEVASLPRCENDMDFGLVREKLGIKREKMGPYWYFLTDSEVEDDGEEDGDGEEAVYEGVKSGA